MKALERRLQLEYDFEKSAGMAFMGLALAVLIAMNSVQSPSLHAAMRFAFYSFFLVSIIYLGECLYHYSKLRAHLILEERAEDKPREN